MINHKTRTTVKNIYKKRGGRDSDVKKWGGKTRLLNYELKVLSVQVVHVMYILNIDIYSDFALNINSKQSQNAI